MILIQSNDGILLDVFTPQREDFLKTKKFSNSGTVPTYTVYKDRNEPNRKGIGSRL